VLILAGTQSVSRVLALLRLMGVNLMILVAVCIFPTSEPQSLAESDSGSDVFNANTIVTASGAFSNATNAQFFGRPWGGKSASLHGWMIRVTDLTNFHRFCQVRCHFSVLRIEVRASFIESFSRTLLSQHHLTRLFGLSGTVGTRGQITFYSRITTVQEVVSAVPLALPLQPSFLLPKQRHTPFLVHLEVITRHG